MKTFEIHGIELERYEAWQAEHDKTCRYYDDGTTLISKSGAIGGRTTFSFTPTGLGPILVVSCACGARNNPTDYDNW